MIAALLVLVGYLIGSIPFGVLVGRVYRGVDVRDYGSGKTGFTNTLRSLGWGAALIVFSADIAKGAAPVLIGRFVFDDPWAVALGGVAAVAGHMFPIFARFRGGRGAATAFGAFTVIAPIAGLVLVICAGIVLAATRYASLTTIAATAAGCLVVVGLVAAGWLPVHYLLFAFAVTASIELGHIGNIRRLLAGVEPKLGQGGAPRAGGA
ncbi:MAG: glycerol-3-phosphate 1-O-acyltransferase PlsY [Chloroflexi bacterium]|nr:glycerol-3-phosphate 1-O-acyltransferase PlsY [Chloroflexota bacterium]